MNTKYSTLSSKIHFKTDSILLWMQANTTFWAHNTGIFLTYFTSTLCGRLSHMTDPIKYDVTGQVRNMPHPHHFVCELLMISIDTVWFPVGNLIWNSEISMTHFANFNMTVNSPCYHNWNIKRIYKERTVPLFTPDSWSIRT